MGISKEEALEELRKRGVLKDDHVTKSLSISPEEAIAELKRRGIEVDSGSIGRSLARGTRNVLAGIGDIGDVLASPIRESVNLGSKLAGSDYRLGTMGESIAQGIDTLTGGYTSPKNPTEKTEEAVTRALSGMPAAGAIGTALKGAASIAPNLGQLGTVLAEGNVINPQNVAGLGLASGTAQHILNEDPQNVLGALAASTAAAALPHSLSNLASQAGREAIAGRIGEKLKVNPRKIEHFEQAGIQPLIADVSDSSGVKRVSNLLENIPFASKPLEKASKERRQDISKILGQTSENINPAEAGELAVKGAKNYQTHKESEFSRMGEKVEKDIRQIDDTVGDLIPVKNVRTYYDKLTSNMRDQDVLKKFDKSPVGKELKSIIGKSKQYNGLVPYESLKQSLDEINDKITTHGLIGKSSQGKLKKLASSINQDIDHGMTPKFKDLGEESYENWKNFREQYHEYASSDIPTLNEMFKKDKKSAVDNFLGIMSEGKKGASQATLMLKGLDKKEKIDFVNAAFKHIGSDQSGNFNPSIWARKFSGLGEHGKSALLSPFPDQQRQRIENVAHAIEHLKGTLSEANFSKTAYYSNLSDILKHTLTGASAAAFLGNPSPLMGMLGTGVVSRLGAEALSNPKIVKWITDASKFKTVAQLDQHLKRGVHMKVIPHAVLNQFQTNYKNFETHHKGHP